jgi:hypothetical protein
LVVRRALVIGISVSDILKLLDQIPIWKTVSQLPKRVSALEERIAVLEAKLASRAVVPGQSCAACGEPALRRTKRVPTTGVFAGMGVMDEEWTCSACGDVEVRPMQK